MDYSPEVLRRFDAPRGVGQFMEGRQGLVEGEASDRSLNIWVRFQVQVTDERIRAVSCQVFGCPHTVAAASWVAEWLEGRAADALTALDVREVSRVLSIPLEKMGKLLRIEDALAQCACSRHAG
jgi:NifU-like protein involved in Fe-S cluster formation